MSRRTHLIGLALITVFLTTCDKGTEVPMGTSPTPALQFSPDTLRFTFPDDPALPDSCCNQVAKSLAIWNSGDGTLDWSIEEHIPWLELSSPSGASTGEVDSVRAFVHFSMIPAGSSVEKQMTISAGKSTATVHVIAENKTPAPLLGFAPDTLIFTLPDDPTVPGVCCSQVAKTLEIWNSSVGTLDWSILEDIPWLELSELSGASSGEVDSVEAIARFSLIPAGSSVESQITVSAGTSTVIIPVIAENRTPVRAFGFSPDTLIFTLPGDPTVPGACCYRVAKTLDIWSLGDDPLYWSVAATSNTGWLRVSPLSGASFGEVDAVEVITQFSSIPDGGTAHGHIRLGDGTTNYTVPVIARKILNRRICTSEDRLDFDREADPDPKTVRISACGNTDGDWDARSDRSWIELSPADGVATESGTDLTVTVLWPQVAGAALSTGTITLFGPANSIEIPVRASVACPSPCLCFDPEVLNLNESDNPGPVQFRVAKCDSGEAISWTVRSDQPWVSLSQASGSSSGEWDDITATVDWSYDWANDPNFVAHVELEGGGSSRILPVHADPNCRLKFTEPNSATQWTAGEWRTIRWDRLIPPGEFYYVNILVYKGGTELRSLGSGPFEPLLYNSGQFQWMVSTYGLASGSDYHLFIYSERTLYDPDCCAQSGNFTITVPECYVSVLHPDQYATERARPGATLEIRWQTHAPTVDVSIDLYREGSFVCNVTPQTENDGAFDWVITRCDSINSSDYQIRVSDVSDSTCAGYSTKFGIRF